MKTEIENREMDASKIEILECQDIEYEDCPDYSNAFISKAQWTDTGKELSEEELEAFTVAYPDVVYEYISSQAVEGGGADWDDYLDR